MFTLPDQVHSVSDVLFQEFIDEAVLLNLKSEEYYGLNEIGMTIYKLLMEQKSTDEIINRLLDEYDVDEQTLRNDLAELISKLAERGLVTVS